MSGAGTAFKGALDDLQRVRDPGNRRWIYVPYDQLSDGIGPLSEQPPERTGIVLVECPAKAARRPYHRQKLALILANQRNFALEQAARGCLVEHIVAPRSFAEGLEGAAARLGPLAAMEPAERELRSELADLITRGSLEVSPHAGWLSTPEDFVAGVGRGGVPPWKLEPFYQHLRRKTGILMDGREPVGGRFNFDHDNRRPYRPHRGDPPAPVPPIFRPNAITEEVGDLILSRFAHHPGRLDLASLPATAADAETLWASALRDCLPHFGPFEDAMHAGSSGLFHTRISPLLNLHRLLPARVIADVLAAPGIPLQSVEGFVRQVLGWREFVRHVHAATDGFRAAPAPEAPVAPSPGDGGYRAWAAELGVDWPAPATTAGVDGGASPSVLGADAPLPPAYWGTRSGLRCLDRVVADVWNEGYSHHITRLMVLSNLATLLGVSPRALTDWFWVAYTDAYDWVVEPNVLAMGTYAVGGLMTTKPYVSGGAYIHKMSDYCQGCAFDPKKSCPVTSLYWDFMARHAELLRRNHRSSGALAGLARRTETQRAQDAAVAQRVRARLQAGEVLTPEGQLL